MLGYPLKVMFRMVEAKGGSSAVAEVKRRAGVPLEKTYRMNDIYADEECMRLFAATGDVLARGLQETCDVFAETFLQDTLKRFPVWYQMCANSREFLEYQPEIHKGFAAGIQDPQASQAVLDKFRLEKRDKELIVHYCSPNRLCMTYRAFARLVIAYYGDEASIEETRCQHQGDDECEIRIRWAS